MLIINQRTPHTKALFYHKIAALKLAKAQEKTDNVMETFETCIAWKKISSAI
jgi:hypothetical protein